MTDPTTGRRHKPSATFRTKAEALDWIARHRGQPPPSPASLTVALWGAEWLPIHKANVSDASYARDASTFRAQVLPWFGGIKLTDLDAPKIEAVSARMLAGDTSKGLAPRTAKAVRRGHAILRKMLSAAVRAKKLPANPFANKAVRPPRVLKTKARPLTPDEITALTRAADRRGLGVLVRVWLELGCRPGELLGLRVEDYSPETGCVLIVRSLDTRNNAVLPPKTARDPLPLSAAVRVMLNAYLRTIPGPALFGTRTGAYHWARNFRRRVWHPLLDAAGIKDRNRYAIRHTTASLLLSAGMSVIVVARRLGHSDPAMTLRSYGHLMPGDQERASAVFAAVWGKIAENSEPTSPHDKPTAAEK